jgi:hypothetical protein
MKTDGTKDWCFGPAVASHFMLADCHERESFTEVNLDEVYGLEQENPEYIDALIKDFSHLTMLWVTRTSSTLRHALHTPL